MKPLTTRRRPWLAGAVLAGAPLLLVTGCAPGDEVPSSTDPGGTESRSPGPAGAESRSPEAAGARSGNLEEERATGSGEGPPPGPAGEAGSDTDGAGQAGGDYVVVDGERLPVMFSGYTVDDSKVAARVIASYCDPDHARTGQFRAWGYLVDDTGQVLTTDTTWVGLVRLSLNTRDDVDVAPYVDVELDDRGLWLSLVDPNPADPDGGFSVDDNVATGDFLVPDMNGGPDQRVEFRVTCPE